MVIAIFGESCTGKSTIADTVKAKNGAKVYSGKDYLRLAKNPADAEKQFVELLNESVRSDECVVFVISETEHLKLIPDGSKRVLVTAGLERIKERFKNRMGGKLPPQVEKMLEAKHGAFDTQKCDLHIDTDAIDAQNAVERIFA